MIIKKIFAKNFMSIGEEPFIVNFEDYSQDRIVLIKGINKDIGYNASNGSGKSIFLESVVFALFDKTIRGISKEECVNNVIGKNLYIELYIDNLKIVRQRRPNKFLLFKDPLCKFDKDSEITESTMACTQERLEQEIGINYKTFLNTCCFGQHNLFSFLSSDAATQRIIIENLLKLSEFNEYEKGARDYNRMIKNEISILSDEYQKVLRESTKKNETLKEYEIKRESYKLQKISEINRIKKELEEIEKIDIAKHIKEWKDYEEGKESLSLLDKEINELNSKYNSFETIISNKMHSTKSEILPIISAIKSIDNDLNNIKNLKPGIKCKSCYQEVDIKNYQTLIEELNLRKEKLTLELEEPYSKITQLNKEKDETLSKIKTSIKEKKEKTFPFLGTKKPLISKDFLLEIKSKKESFLSLLSSKEKELDNNPYIEIFEKNKEELLEINKTLEENKNNLSNKEELLPYYNFWIQGFGEKGIKSFVVEQIIPVLNQQINYWLQFFIDNKIIVEFDKYLNIKISRSSSEQFLYNQSSGGERKRIDLAISLAFAYIMRLRSGVESNILFLDELTESIDVDGVEGMYRALLELSRDKTIFIITHNSDLINKLDMYKKIIITKENGFSKIL